MLLLGIVIFMVFGLNINLGFGMQRLFLVYIIFKLLISDIHFEHLDDTHLIVIN